MLALALTNKKDFMNKFLKTEIFDHFLLQEAKKGIYQMSTLKDVAKEWNESEVPIPRQIFPPCP